MTEFRILTAEEAQKIARVTNHGTEQKPDLHEIRPIALADGVTYILPLEVLTDAKLQITLTEFKSDPRIAIDLKAESLKREVVESEFKIAAEQEAYLDAIGAGAV